MSKKYFQLTPILAILAGSWLAFIGCDRKVPGTPNSSGPACDASRMELANANLPKAQGFTPGTYQLAASNHLWRYKDENMVATQTLETGGRGERQLSARLVCPEANSLSTVLVDGVQREFVYPDTLVVNSAGEVELPESFSMARLSLVIEGRKIRIGVMSLPTTLARENIAKDHIQTRKEMRVTPLVDGLLLTAQVEAGQEKAQTLARYRRVNPGAVSRGPVVVKDKFSLEECLEKTKIKLGSLTKEQIRFNDDCSQLWLVRGTPSIQIISVSTLGAVTPELCTANRNATGAIVTLRLSTNEMTALRELTEQNPGFSNIAPDPASRGADIFHRREFNGNQLIISGISSPGVARRNGFENVFVRGNVTGSLRLNPSTTCHFVSQLKAVADKKNPGDEVIDWARREFGIEFFFH